MHILCVTAYYKPAYAYGGPTRSVSALCEGLAAAGVTVTVFTTNANGPGQTLDVSTNVSTQVDGVEVYYYPQSPLAHFLPFYAPALGQACKSRTQNFDLVYVCATWTYPMLAAAKAAQQANIPYVVSPMGAFMKGSLEEKWLKKRLYLSLIERGLVNKAAAIRCTSMMEQRELEPLSFQTKTRLIPEALDLSPFVDLPRPGSLRHKLGISPDTPLSMFVGRLAPEKRLDLVIDAFAEVIEQVSQAHLVVIGPDGGQEGMARAQVAARELQNRVHFLGMLTGSELQEAYADADTLVLLSKRENFGMVAVEAMAAGIPLLLSRNVALAEEVSLAEAGYAVSDNINEISSAWIQLLMRKMNQEMGARGRILAQQKFSQEIVTAQMLEFFEQIVEEYGVSNSATPVLYKPSPSVES